MSNTQYAETAQAAHIESSFDMLPTKEWPQQWQPTQEYPTPQSMLDAEFENIIDQEFRSKYFVPNTTDYKFGESDLPVAPYREAIVNAVHDNQTLVISAETGSGKSSQIGLYLLEAGAPRVFITQPRILAARELMQRARQNLGPDHEHLAGYLTGTQADSDCPPDARIIYVTEHLLFKMMNRGEIGGTDTVIFDEAHEESTPAVIAMGLAKDILPDHADMRMVACSATINSDEFAQHLSDPQTGKPAPVLILPGRTHPIEWRESTDDTGTEAKKHMRKNKNVIMFEPGLAPMKRTKSVASSRMSKETVHLLYADQSPLEQKEALTAEDHHHVVTNRTGETSLTPPNKQVAVMSGLSNLGGFNAGVRSLTTEYSSKATLGQQAGRVGRLEEGLAVLATPAEVPAPPAYADRAERDPAPIQNSDITSFMAELLAVGRRIEDLDLKEMPPQENIEYGYRTLARLGAVAMDGDVIVPTGILHAMNNLGLDTPLARMIVESQRLAEEDGADGDSLRLQVAAAASVLSSKSLLDATKESQRRYAHPKPHQEVLSTEQKSDVLFELDVFTWLYDKQRQIMSSNVKDPEKKFDKVLADYDIIPNRYYKAVRTFNELCLREKLTPEDLTKASSTQRGYIIGSQITGAAEVFVQKGKRSHYDIRGERRMIGRRSTIESGLGSLAIGVAFDLNMLGKRGSVRKRLITDASLVTVEQLRKYAPNRLSEVDLGYGVSRKGELVKKIAYYFDDELNIGQYDEPLPATEESRTALITAMMTGEVPGARGPQGPIAFLPKTPRASRAIRIWRAAQVLEENSSVMLKTAERHQSLIRKVARESLAKIPLDVTNVESLDDVIPPVYRNALVKPTRRSDIPGILQTSPDGITVRASADERCYVPVKYKTLKSGGRAAYVEISRDLLASVSREDFADLAQHHPVKVRLGNGKFMQLDAAFEKIEQDRRNAELVTARRQERSARVAARAAIALTAGPSPEREYRPRQDPRSARLEANRRQAARQAKGMVKVPTNNRDRKKYEKMRAEPQTVSI